MRGIAVMLVHYTLTSHLPDRCDTHPLKIVYGTKHVVLAHDCSASPAGRSHACQEQRGTGAAHEALAGPAAS